MKIIASRVISNGGQIQIPESILFNLAVYFTGCESTEAFPYMYILGKSSCALEGRCIFFIFRGFRFSYIFFCHLNIILPLPGITNFSKKYFSLKLVNYFVFVLRGDQCNIRYLDIIMYLKRYKTI